MKMIHRYANSKAFEIAEITSPDELKDIKVLGTVMGGKAFPASPLTETVPADKAP